MSLIFSGPLQKSGGKKWILFRKPCSRFDLVTQINQPHNQLSSKEERHKAFFLFWESLCFGISLIKSAPVSGVWRCFGPEYKWAKKNHNGSLSENQRAIFGQNNTETASGSWCFGFSTYCSLILITVTGALGSAGVSSAWHGKLTSASVTTEP